ncbi:NfeD family protein [Candidatus Solirubrobacter pratensis]|uniref:NfeD family protein n=1 Tax=Candidatus Solirubrobacter pratensis TaxID=1298857 RepID=UPI00041F00CD|nr:NfeD family protein [Candidatus Solirubrobacter pratensis]
MSALGLLLVLVGATLVVAEAHLPSHGVLGSAAVLSLALGVALALSGAGTGVGVSLAAGVGIGLAGALCVWILVRKALATRRLLARNGLIGRVGTVRDSGQVFVDGGLWRARVWDLQEEPALRPGDAVVVEHVNGLTLTVRHAEEWEVAP